MRPCPHQCGGGSGNFESCDNTDLPLSVSVAQQFGHDSTGCSADPGPPKRVGKVLNLWMETLWGLTLSQESLETIGKHRYLPQL